MLWREMQMEVRKGFSAAETVERAAIMFCMVYYWLYTIHSYHYYYYNLTNKGTMRWKSMSFKWQLHITQSYNKLLCYYILKVRQTLDDINACGYKPYLQSYPCTPDKLTEECERALCLHTTPFSIISAVRTFGNKTELKNETVSTISKKVEKYINCCCEFK